MNKHHSGHWIQDAVKQASAGKEVTVVAYRVQDIPRLMELAYQNAAESKPSKRHTREGDRLAWDNGGSVRFISAGTCSRDELLDLHVRGTDHLSVMLVDHAAIEFVFTPLLRMLHQYDPEEKE